MCELIEAGEKEQLEDLLCQDYPAEHTPYSSQEAQDALHLLTSQAGCDLEILQWLIDTGLSPNKPCPTQSTSALYKATVVGNTGAVKVSLLSFFFFFLF